MPLHLGEYNSIQRKLFTNGLYKEDILENPKEDICKLTRTLLKYKENKIIKRKKENNLKKPLNWLKKAADKKKRKKK